MSVFKVHPDTNKFKGFYPTETDENAILEMEGGLGLFGKERKEDWRGVPVYLEELEDRDKGVATVPDLVRFQNSYALSEKAKRILEPHLSPEDELLPLKHGGETWYVLNVMKKVEATDKEKTKYLFTDSMSILGIKKHVFKMELLEGVNLFKIGDTGYVEIYCNEGSFKKTVEDNGLTGLKFTEL